MLLGFQTLTIFLRLQNWFSVENFLYCLLCNDVKISQDNFESIMFDRFMMYRERSIQCYGDSGGQINFLEFDRVGYCFDFYDETSLLIGRIPKRRNRMEVHRLRT